jgi:hypothetical protein
MKESLENIRDLTGRLYPPAGAERIASELSAADKELGEIFPDVGPDKELLDAIKSEVTASLRTQKRHFWLWNSAAVAALLAVAAIISVRVFLTPAPAVTDSPKVIVASAAASVEIREMSWDQSDELTELSTNIESIENAFYASDYEFGDADTNIVEIETQVNELKELFWKG